jgi:hypothetical protein
MGDTTNIYNPWSILNYPQKGKFAPYWVKTSSNSLACKLIQEGSPELKQDCELLLAGSTIHSRIDEQTASGEIRGRASSVWSLLLPAPGLRLP